MHFQNLRKNLFENDEKLIFFNDVSVHVWINEVQKCSLLVSCNKMKNVRVCDFKIINIFKIFLNECNFITIGYNLTRTMIFFDRIAGVFLSFLSCFETQVNDGNVKGRHGFLLLSSYLHVRKIYFSSYNCCSYFPGPLKLFFDFCSLTKTHFRTFFFSLEPPHAIQYCLR